eukprot:g1758.t1
MNKMMSLGLLGAGFFLSFLGLIGSGNIVLILKDSAADAVGADYLHGAPFYTYWNKEPNADDQTEKLDCGDIENDDDFEQICIAQQFFGSVMLLTLLVSTAVTALFLLGKLQNKMINMGVFGVHALVTILFMCIVLGYGQQAYDSYNSSGDVVDSWGPSWSWVFELIGTGLSAVAVFMGEAAGAASA